MLRLHLAHVLLLLLLLRLALQLLWIHTGTRHPARHIRSHRPVHHVVVVVVKHIYVSSGRLSITWLWLLLLLLLRLSGLAGRTDHIRADGVLLLVHLELVFWWKKGRRCE